MRKFFLVCNEKQLEEMMRCPDPLTYSIWNGVRIVVPDSAAFSDLEMKRLNWKNSEILNDCND